ncbi:MAG: hypothetical protein KME26_03395 [Oscillatoria princeps RMCB-10]|nr:hypothetical protein [Oscillatoria princeps RMCB-10]
MKLWKSLAGVLILLVSLMFAQPSLASSDQPAYTKNPDYIEVTETLNSLLKAESGQTQAEGYTPEELQKKIAELELQKYALETGVNWGQCRNETGKKLAVYGPRRKKSDLSYDKGLYFLANGQTTQDEWDCEGVYLPTFVRATYISTASGQPQNLAGGVALKIIDGTELVVKTNPDTGAVELNVPPAKVFKAGEVNWFIPNVSQALIDSQLPNAPTNGND